MAVRNMEAINRAASQKAEARNINEQLFRDAEQKVLQLHDMTVDFVDTLVAIKEKDLLSKYKNWNDLYPIQSGNEIVKFDVRVRFLPERKIYFHTYADGGDVRYVLQYWPEENMIVAGGYPVDEIGARYTTDNDVFEWMGGKVGMYQKLIEVLAVRIPAYCNDFFKWMEVGLKS
jgi:hypothetical protein